LHKPTAASVTEAAVLFLSHRGNEVILKSNIQTAHAWMPRLLPAAEKYIAPREKVW